MDTLSRPAAIALLVAFVGMLSIPTLDQANDLFARHVGTVVIPVEEQGRFRFWSPVLSVKLANGKLILAEAPRDLHSGARPGDSIVINEYESTILRRHVYRAQHSSVAP